MAVGRYFWQLEDIKGNRHRLTFNMDVNNPLLTDGWSSLRVFYKLQHIHQILFRFVGNSTFQITVFSDMTAISTATKFLTNIHRLRTKHLFRVKLTKSQTQASHLVNNVLLYCFLYAILFIYVFIYLTVYFFFSGPTNWLCSLCSEM